jgi:1-acylglycerone phosphate reductase
MTPKTVLITGCSAGGIGFALAHEFHRHGLTVFATTRDVTKMHELETLPNTTLLPLDVTSPAAIASAVQEVSQRTDGKLDYLINNSGQSLHAPALDTDIDDAMRLFDVNFWGVLRMVQAFAPLLIKAGGTVVNIGSIVGILHMPFGSKSFFPRISYI